MREYNVIARITAYINNQAVKSKVVTNPLVYTTNDRIVTAKSFVQRNETLFNFYAVHNSAAFSKELDVLRSLTNMAYIKPCKARHNAKYRAHLALIGLEDFESFLDQERDMPSLYLDIAIHATEGEKKRQKVLTHISFRVLSTDPTTAVELKALTDWFRLEPKETEEAPKEDQSVIYPNPSFTPTSVEQVKEDKKKYFESKEFDALTSSGTSFGTIAMFANDWIKEAYFPKVRDVTVLAYHINVISKAMIELDISNPLTNPDTMSDLDKRILEAYKLLRDFLTVMESKAVVDTDLFRLVGRSCRTIGIPQISKELHAKAFNLAKSNS